MSSNNNNTGSGSGKGGQTHMTKDDAARIQAAQARSGGDMGSGGFAARAQSAADRNANAENSNTGNTKK